MCIIIRKVESSDRISGLPDHILVEILSLLPLKSAVSTAVLSRQWRWLWTQLPSIHFSIDDTDFCNRKDEFYCRIHNLLPKFTLPSIRRFSLDLGFYCTGEHRLFPYPDNNYSHILSCFDWVSVHNKGLQELRFNIQGDGHGLPFPDPPLRIFQIPSLVLLELRPWFLVHHDVHEYTNALFNLPNLKKIVVELHSWNPQLLEKLVSSCPCLEDLFFELCHPTRIRVDGDKYTTLNLSSHSLKLLDMKLNYPTLLSLNTPNLEYLSIHIDCFDRTLPNRVSFVNARPSLLACSFTALTDKLYGMFLPSNISTVISNVVTLTLNDMKPNPVIAPVTFTCVKRLKLEFSHIYISRAGYTVSMPGLGGPRFGHDRLYKFFPRHLDTA
ncbi:hypothetical protein RND81_02G247200 [Saponaria officinalis]|uniref:F-box domain-containing protein n=1 Tax=Saponaria officinalis TaxID=3572 RepID=A0AAW1MXM9_SAPOF